ncbi:MAG: hypothetical protein RIQ94_3195 [Pseudomonadota bacterium]
MNTHHRRMIIGNTTVDNYSAATDNSNCALITLSRTTPSVSDNIALAYIAYAKAN